MGYCHSESTTELERRLYVAIITCSFFAAGSVFLGLLILTIFTFLRVPNFWSSYDYPCLYGLSVALRIWSLGFVACLSPYAALLISAAALVLGDYHAHSKAMWLYGILLACFSLYFRTKRAFGKQSICLQVSDFILLGAAISWFRIRSPRLLIPLALALLGAGLPWCLWKYPVLLAADIFEKSVATSPELTYLDSANLRLRSCRALVYVGNTRMACLKSVHEIESLAKKGFFGYDLTAEFANLVFVSDLDLEQRDWIEFAASLEASIDHVMSNKPSKAEVNMAEHLLKRISWGYYRQKMNSEGKDAESKLKSIEQSFGRPLL